MSELFNPVPDWFSFENQGGNVATIDLDNDGHLDLLVCAIDHSTPGPNRGLYRVGKKLDRDGLVAGSWGPWMDIPNWFSFENQGCAIAVADLNANGRPDLVVFTVDHRVPGPNRGIFQVGRDLDANGNVTGGWTGWIDVANWFSWDNQGAAIALTQLGPGRSWDLVVFTTDHRVPGPNRGIYQVGKSIDANGQVHGGWGGWIDIDWFSWENQGVGIAFHDLDGNGRPELIAFQIDNPPQLNSGQYRIGWNIDTNGVPNDGWGRWNIIPGWESWDNQGGGISVGDFDGSGRPQLLVFQIDNPVGPNRGLYRRVVLENDLNDAAQKGTWRLLPYLSQVLPVHAGLLHTGKVLFFAGSGNSFVRSDSPWFGNLNAGIYTSVLWDFAKGNAFNHPPTAFDGNGKVLDFFCGGHAFLSDGRLLVAGGTLVYDHHNPKNEFQGRRETLIFDPATEKWKQAASMKDGRWYPTLISLADGRVLAATGLNSAVDSRTNLCWKFSIPGPADGWRSGKRNCLCMRICFFCRMARSFTRVGRCRATEESLPAFLISQATRYE